MPWHVAKSDSCPESKPWAVIKDADGEVVACHETEEAAERQLAALYANEPRRRDMLTTPEILVRNDGSLTDVDRKLRLIEMIAVPWDQEAEVLWRGDIWTEVFTRGAFDGIEARAGSIRANREHVKGQTVGKLIDFDPHHTVGLFTRMKVVKGPKGDEVLDLAEDDMISPSVGYRANKPSDVRLDKQTRRRTVLNAFLDHLGMVEDPAFKGARVLAVRGEPSGSTDEGPLPATPLLDEFMNDPVLSWARDRFSI